MLAKKTDLLILTALCAGVVALADVRAAAKPDYLGLARAYAEAMIAKGRDTCGPESTPLFAAALDRRTMKLGTAAQFGAIPGVREHDRMLGGANPQHDMELYELLYDLTRLTGDRRYAAAADQALGHFFNHCQSPATGLMAWGEHIYWDFTKETAAWVRHDEHEVMGEWPFWDTCYRLAPDASWRFALGLWDHQVADKRTGDFSRHALYSRPAPGSGSDFPRYAGQMIATWADAYARPENAARERRTEMLTAISAVVGRMEQNEKMLPSGHLPAHHGQDYVWPSSNLELARCLWPAAGRVEKADPALAQRMRALALRQDAKFLAAPHTLPTGGGFAATLHTVTGEPRSRAENRPYTEAWSTGYGQGTHAGPANLCVARWRQLEAAYPALASGYRQLALAAADQYLTATPPADALLKPAAFAEAIELLLSAHERTGDAKYLERADTFGRLGVTLFLDDGLPLPKASNRHAHYEAITGGPAFMRALLRLHERLTPR